MLKAVFGKKLYENNHHESKIIARKNFKPYVLVYKKYLNIGVVKFRFLVKLYVFSILNSLIKKLLKSSFFLKLFLGIIFRKKYPFLSAFQFVFLSFRLNL